MKLFKVFLGPDLKTHHQLSFLSCGQVWSKVILALLLLLISLQVLVFRLRIYKSPKMSPCHWGQVSRCRRECAGNSSRCSSLSRRLALGKIQMLEPASFTHWIYLCVPDNGFGVFFFFLTTCSDNLRQI